MNLAGEEASTNYWHKGAIRLCGFAETEFFAVIALCPLEMTMAKIQTSPAGTFPIRIGTALPDMSILKATRSAPSSPSSCARYIPTSVTSA